MADYDSIASTGRSVVRLLNHGFAEGNPLPLSTTPTAVLIRTEDFKAETNNESVAALSPPAVSIFFYRVDVNRTMRAPWSAVGNYEGRAHLPLDLHFLLTPWAGNAEYELLLLGRAMQWLETHPILTGPLLDPGGSWAPGDAVQVTIAEITTEEVMRTFDSLPVDFKLSIPYVARVIRLSEQQARPRPEVERTLVGIGRPLGPVDPQADDASDRWHPPVVRPVELEPEPGQEEEP
ncbi:MAG: DUF4255 domain-containing protein [Enhygromyxa sp.]